MKCEKFRGVALRKTVYALAAILFFKFAASHSYFYSDNEARLITTSKKNLEESKNSKERTNNALKTIPVVGRSTIFSTENSTVVHAQIGGTATLPCVVRKFNNGVVSWIRKQESPTLLTVGLTTYSTDDRFFVEHVRHLQNWCLLIKHVQPSDAGQYECQISTHPPASIFVYLKVNEAVAEILGFPDVHLRAGSTLRLKCVLKYSTETPSYVFWYRDQRMINYDEGIIVLADGSSSVLFLREADQRHSGNYTCSPSNAVPTSISVHVLNSTEEENPAAMLHANRGNTSNSVLSSFIAIFFVNLFFKKAFEI